MKTPQAIFIINDHLGRLKSLNIKPISNTASAGTIHINTCPKKNERTNILDSSMMLLRNVMAIPARNIPSKCFKGFMKVDFPINVKRLIQYLSITVYTLYCIIVVSLFFISFSIDHIFLYNVPIHQAFQRECALTLLY